MQFVGHFGDSDWVPERPKTASQLNGEIWTGGSKKSWPHDGPKIAQDRPKMAQDWPKMAKDGPKMAQDGPEMGQDGPRMAMRQN